MIIEGWEYYNHAAVTTCAPHNEPNLLPIKDGSIWKIKGALMACWTTDWDCGHETKWWYVIKDEPFDLNVIKSKRRYEINKGNKNFEIRIINPLDYVNEIYRVTIDAYESWPQKYRPSINEDAFKKYIISWNNKRKIMAAFSKEDGILCGYAALEEYDNYVAFPALRVCPAYEKLGINAAIVFGILKEYEKKLMGDFYICDGTRSIRHESAFQDYLEKYFGFRKAYCKLNIKYKTIIRICVIFLYPLRKLIKGKTSMGNKILALLMMEEYSR